jgi:hypothetical protein
MTARPAAPAQTLRALVAGVVDYAGLFPPAALSMADAAAAYAEYLASPEAWALGRFVVPSPRLDELSAESAPYTAARSEPWRLSVLVGNDSAADAERICAFNAAHMGRLLVDVAEARALSPGVIESAVGALGAKLTVYVELPVADEPREWLHAVKCVGARAKVRTGGTTAAAIPSAQQVARFIARCAELGVPFKATAGLHHPLRGEQKLTYEPSSPSATMFGFVNVFLAAAFARAGMTEPTIVHLLEERDPTAMSFADDGVRWREHAITLDELRRARTSFAVAFGSCSFREPIDDLHGLALL